MPTIPILNYQDRKQFDSVPEFDSHKRKQFFRVSSQIQNILDTLRTPTTKVALVLMLGYFKYSHQLFMDFNKADVEYVKTRLGFGSININMTDFNRFKFRSHKKKVLSLCGWSDFGKVESEVLKSEIQFMLRSQTRHKVIFEAILDKLILRKIEIPSYNLLANLIDQEYKNYDKKIDQILINSLGNKVINELNAMLNRNQSSGELFDNTPYILTTLKRFNQSNKPGKIQKNLVALTSLKSLFTKLEPARGQIDFTNEGIKYYASLTIKQELFQLTRRNENERLIYFYCFIVSQYQKLQDLLVDTIYYTVYSYQNQAKKAMEASYLETKTDNDKFFELVKVSRKKQAASYGTMKKIIQDNDLGAELKIQQLTLLITEAEKSLPDPELIKTLETAKNMDENYFLEVQARKIIIRLSSIVQELDFDRDPQSNDQEILQAIDYYKANKGEVGDKAPTGFLSKADLKAVKAKSERKEGDVKHPILRKALYKVCLFKEISKHLKAGSLNLKHSFRYKSAEESLIGATDFGQNMDNYLNLAGQAGNKDGKVVLATIVKYPQF